MERKYLKKEARKNIRKHYFKNVILLFIVSLIISGKYNYNTNFNYLNISIYTRIFY